MRSSIPQSVNYNSNITFTAEDNERLIRTQQERQQNFERVSLYYQDLFNYVALLDKDIAKCEAAANEKREAIKQAAQNQRLDFLKQGLNDKNKDESNSGTPKFMPTQGAISESAILNNAAQKNNEALAQVSREVAEALTHNENYNVGVEANTPNIPNSQNQNAGNFGENNLNSNLNNNFNAANLPSSSNSNSVVTPQTSQGSFETTPNIIPNTQNNFTQENLPNSNLPQENLPQENLPQSNFEERVTNQSNFENGAISQKPEVNTNTEVNAQGNNTLSSNLNNKENNLQNGNENQQSSILTEGEIWSNPTIKVNFTNGTTLYQVIPDHLLDFLDLQVEFRSQEELKAHTKNPNVISQNGTDLFNLDTLITKRINEVKEEQKVNNNSYTSNSFMVKGNLNQNQLPNQNAPQNLQPQNIASQDFATSNQNHQNAPLNYPNNYPNENLNNSGNNASFDNSLVPQNAPLNQPLPNANVAKANTNNFSNMPQEDDEEYVTDFTNLELNVDNPYNDQSSQAILKHNNLENMLREEYGMVIRKENTYMKEVDDDYARFILELKLKKADELVACSSVRTIISENEWKISIPETYYTMAKMGFLEIFKKSVVEYLNQKDLKISYEFIKANELPDSPMSKCHILWEQARNNAYREMVSDKNVVSLISKLSLNITNASFEVIEPQKVKTNKVKTKII
ncbi:MAG: hypothetical protein SPK04_08910 [Succinivibrionaceae bacterium]|nr:hypothetical protein [Succinivibrionaceae bacterium]